MPHVSIRGARTDELPEIAQLLSSVFHRAHPEFFLAHFRNHPRSLPEHSRIVEVDGRIIGHLRIYDQSVRVADTSMRVGALGGVMTLPEYRGCGYARQCLNDAFDYLTQHHYDLSTVVSNNGLYERCGWSALPRARSRALIQEIRVVSDSGYQVRRFERDGDLQEVAAVYAAFCRNRGASQIRTSEYWRKHFNWIRESEEGFLVATQRERVVGYVRSSIAGKHLRLTEACFADGHEGSGSTLLQSLCRFAKARSATIFETDFPSDHPMINLINTTPAFVQEISSTFHVRFLNLTRLLSRLQSSLQRRVSERSLGDVSFIVEVDNGERAGVDVSEFNVNVGGAGVACGAPVLHCSQQELFRVLLSLDSPSDLGWCDRLSLDSLAATAIDELFAGPKPIYWQTDVV